MKMSRSYTFLSKFLFIYFSLTKHSLTKQPLTGDIRELHATTINPGTVAAVKEICTPHRYKDFLNFTHPMIQKLGIDPEECGFNAGVFVADIKEWKKRAISDQLANWMHLNTIYPLYGGGTGGGVSQPVLMIVLHKLVTILPDEWHLNQMGKEIGAKATVDDIANAKLVHWNGETKPWNKVFKAKKLHAADIWRKYCIPEPKLESIRFISNGNSNSDGNGNGNDNSNSNNDDGGSSKNNKPDPQFRAQIVADAVSNGPLIQDQNLDPEEYFLLKQLREDQLKNQIAVDCDWDIK